MREETRKSPPSRFLARLVALTVLVGPIGLSGCGGSFGVENGTILGTVLGGQTVGDGFNEIKPPIPLEGVTVVAVRQGGDPAVIRTATSDEDGKYAIANVPTGEYLIGFSKRGFRTIDTAMGATNDRTAIGNQVRVFVEAEAVALAPDIVMERLPDEGESTIVVTLVDSITGAPVTNATVIIGVEASTEGGSNGVYTLNVPVQNFGDMLNPAAIEVSAEGYDGGTLAPAQITPVPNETINITVTIQPLPATINGFVEIDRFPTLYDVTGITITVENVPESFSQGSVANSSGLFSVRVPASTGALTRQFNLRFTAANLQTRVVPNVVSPTAGSSRELSSSVIITPKLVDLLGTVLDSTGNLPSDAGQLPDSVTITETGQRANILNGTYTIPDVPTVDAQVGPATLNLDVRVFNPTPDGGGAGQLEQAQEAVNPVSDGASNPVFTVRTIQTQ